MANRRREDPYKGFNFQVAFGAALAAIAGFAIVRKLMPGVAAKYRNPGDYVADVPAASRPIEGVGTNVATMPRSAPKSKAKSKTKAKAKTKPKASGSGSRKSPRKKSSGGAKRR